MALTIPNKGDALADVQSILFKQHLDILVAGVEGNGITSGCAVAPSAGMVISVGSGEVVRVGTTAAVSAATPTVSAAHATLPRLDLVVVTSGNAVAIRAGTAAINPVPPAMTAGDIGLALVLVPAAITAILAGHITDARIDVETNSKTATALATARAINGTNFDGSGAITTSSWGTARTLTLGSTGKSVDGSAAVTWTLAEIGAQAALGYTPVNKAGDTMTGSLSLIDGVTEKYLTLGSSGASLYGNATTYGIWKTGGVSLSVNVSNGDFTTSGNITAYSDARLKMDLEVIPNALNKIQRLTGYTYTRIDSGVRQTGLIAQDVQAVLPEAVDPSGEYMSLAYGNLVGLLVEAIKEQQKQIDDLKARML